MTVVANPEVARRVEVVKPEDIKRRGLGHMEPDRRHVGIERARPVARRAIDKDAPKSAEPEQVLTTDLQVEKAVEYILSFKIEIVEDDFARPRSRAVRRPAVPAELVCETAIESPETCRASIALQLGPNARAEADVVAIARLTEAERAEAAIRIPRDMVHYLLANAKVCACVKAKPRVVGFLDNGFWSGRCRNCSFRSSGFRGSGL